jgi:sec-independent protein translocase protein TatA
MFEQFAFLDLSAPELLIILLIILLLFGGKNLPKLSRSLGESMREFRKGIDEGAKNENKTNTNSKKRAAKKKKTTA